jgi:hypothetical protein
VLLVGPITGDFDTPPPHATYQAPPNHTPSTPSGRNPRGRNVGRKSRGRPGSRATTSAVRRPRTQKIV